MDCSVSARYEKVQYFGGRYFVTYFTRTVENYFGEVTHRVVASRVPRINTTPERMYWFAGAALAPQGFESYLTYWR